MERTEWSDLRQENPNKIESSDISDSDYRPTLLYGCETWPMSVKDEKCMATTEMRMVRWAMGVSLLEHRRNEEILEEAKVEAIANIRAVAEMKMEGKRPRGRPKLRWKDTIRRDLKAWKIKEEWATDREKWKLRSLQDPLPRTGRRRRKVRKVRKSCFLQSSQRLS